MISAPELNKKVSLSLYAIVAIISVTVVITGTAVKVLDNDEQRSSQKEYFDKEIANIRNEIQDLKEFLLGEVDGHRKDENRRFVETLNPRITKLENKIK